MRDNDKQMLLLYQRGILEENIRGEHEFTVLLLLSGAIKYILQKQQRKTSHVGYNVSNHLNPAHNTADACRIGCWIIFKILLLFFFVSFNFFSFLVGRIAFPLACYTFAGVKVSLICASIYCQNLPCHCSGRFVWITMILGMKMWSNVQKPSCCSRNLDLYMKSLQNTTLLVFVNMRNT